MLRETTASAPTVEEAKAKALQELGISEDTFDLEIEVLVFPEKKKFGLFGGKPAEVKVSYDDGKPEPKEAKPRAAKPAPKKSEEKKPAEKKAEERKPASKQQPVKQQSVKKKAEERPSAERPSAENDKQPKADNPVKGREEAKEKAVAYVRDILSHMNVGEYTLEVKDIEGGFCISLAGNGLGVVIGRRGETLDALQYLISLSYSNESGFIRVVLDANDYRAKREQTLQALARKVADQVLETRRNQSLEPMNPYERRVIHTAIQAIDGVTSWSISDGSDRRVIVGLAKEDGTPVDPDYKPMHRSGGRGRDGRGDRRRGGRSRRDSARVESSAPKRDKRSDAGDLPLFGRIDNK